MIKAIVFDLDDTLIKEYDYILSGYKVIAEHLSLKYKLNYDEVFERLVISFNTSKNNVFNQVFDYYGIKYSKDDIIELVTIYRNHIPNIELTEENKRLLMSLRNYGFKLGVITDGYKETQINKVKALGLENYFDDIIITDLLGPNQMFWKPHKLPFETAKINLNVSFDEMIYVGDNPNKDFFIGSIYPIKTVQIINKGIYKESIYFKGVKPHYKINELIEILNIVGVNQ